MVYNKSIYHLGNCNVCGAKLECRADDNSMAIQKRIDIFNQNKDALLEFYGNKVKAINAEAVAEDVQEAAINIIKESKVGCKNTK